MWFKFMNYPKKSIFTSFLEIITCVPTGMDAKQKHVFHLGEAGITVVVQPGTSLFLQVVLVSQCQAQVLSKELESY